MSSRSHSKQDRNLPVSGVPVLVRIEPVAVVELNLCTIVHVATGEIDTLVATL